MTLRTDLSNSTVQDDTHPEQHNEANQAILDLQTPPVGTSLATTGTVNLDMAAVNGTYQAITLTGNPTFTTSNRAAGRTVSVKLSAGGSTRSITWPSWIPLGTALPTSLDSGKVALFTVTFFDGTDASAVAAYAAQP